MTDTDHDVLNALAPVLLELGKAVYICQAFEDSLCLLLSQLAHETANGEDGAFQAAWDFHSTKPLGGLLGSLRKKIDVPADLDEYLATGVKRRNEIVHGYLTRNATRLYDPIGRLEVERELAELKLEVKSRDIAVNKLIDAVLKKYGMSNVLLKRRADDLWDFLNRQDSSSAH